MTMFAILMISYVCAGIALGVLHFLYRSEYGKRHMISDDPHRSVDDRRLYRDAALNTGVSVALIFSVTFGLGDYLFYSTPTPIWVMVVEALAVVLIYDFAYYFFHRYPLHEWKLLRKAHVLHHTVKYPTALESLFVHPVENLLGVVLMMACMLVAGPVSIWAFARMTMPGMQNPHCSPPHAANASANAVRSSASTPSRVSTDLPATLATGCWQLTTALPSMWTVQQPH